ncbi:MAG: hypothetical protein JNK82_35625, partial [Myxococcaceae bacterium]|nr:hypothetical protein [Myxococcaceae bacterium]
PYLHDGSVKTLRDRVYQGGNKHGALDKLESEQERSDLIEYLKTL